MYINSKSSISWLNDVLIGQKAFPYLTEEEFKSLNDSQKSFVDNRFNKVLNDILTEWIIEVFNKEKHELDTEDLEAFKSVRCCELCGNKNIKYISKIRNHISNKFLFVGSECIKNYDQIKDSSGQSFGQLLKLKKEKECIRKNEYNFEKNNPGLLKNIDRFYNFENENDILLTMDFERKKLDLIDKVKKFNQYKTLKSVSSKRLGEIKVISDDLSRFFRAYDNYVYQSKNNIYGITKEITFLCKTLDERVVKKIKEQGEITQDTISYIKEPKFLSKVIPLFEPLLKNNNLKLGKGNVGLTFQLSLNNNLFFGVNSLEFLSDYKEYLWDSDIVKVINVDKLIKSANISTKDSLEKALSIIDFIQLRAYDIELKFYDVAIDELAFKYKGYFYVVELKKFINNYKIAIINDNFDSSLYNNMVDYIIKCNDFYSYADYREHLKQYHIDLKNVL